ncbi:hypothetical protein TSH100_01755 [Azospirillum sp. TSH100]|uniref:YcjF family protein n=1 Tax=Azospirillum sp. TSH100 TaxID=652764 RepID=UPI000D613B17|nr:DUF697 domain-containing protein [Azospirillum sp. TSH100]PWC90782.1 hypothetical protein TSH100_01755 [Azospirillum sp. TSH100]QCG90869.1 DUF697 domain-containing protein [Azospirillum sp. TSH100]
MTNDQHDTTPHTEPQELQADVGIDRQANDIVAKHAKWAAGLGLIPVPGVDLAAITAAQYKMLHELADLFEVPFPKERMRAAISALLGGGVPFLLSTGALGSLAKSIPVIGSLAGMAVMPSLAAATTLALGRVFTTHFATGGTLLDFNIESLRKHFETELAKAKHDAHSIVEKATEDKAAKKDLKPTPAVN